MAPNWPVILLVLKLLKTSSNSDSFITRTEDNYEDRWLAAICYPYLKSSSAADFLFAADVADATDGGILLLGISLAISGDTSTFLLVLLDCCVGLVLLLR